MPYTYTYSKMPVSKSTYEEIKKYLLAADYGHAIHEDREGECLDLHGIALVEDDGKMFNLIREQEKDKSNGST